MIFLFYILLMKILIAIWWCICLLRLPSIILYTTFIFAFCSVILPRLILLIYYLEINFQNLFAFEN